VPHAPPISFSSIWSPMTDTQQNQICLTALTWPTEDLRH
jgi:hypothetical protein